MIDLRPNCVAQYKMNDDRDSPWVVGLNGIPTELVTNNTFDDASDWTEGANWTIAGGSALCSGQSGYLVDNNASVELGKWYFTVFEVKDYVEGGVFIEVGDTKGSSKTANGTYIKAVYASGLNTQIRFHSTFGPQNFRVDNVYVICLDDFPLTGAFNDLTSDHSVTGKVNKALSFDGLYNFINCGNPDVLKFGTGDFSFAIWFKLSVSPQSNYPVLISKGTYSTVGGYLFYMVDNKFKLILDAKTSIVGNTTLNDNLWHLGIAVKEGNDLSLYLDNVLDGSGTRPDIDITSDIDVGIGARSLPAGNNYFDNTIDVTAIFDKALSEAERDWLWNGGNGRELPTGVYHRIYRGQDGNIDYGTPAAEMELDDSQVTIVDQALPANTIWHYIRRQIDDECALESDDSPVCIVAIDSNGDMIGDTPNSPVSLTIERLSNGRFLLRWRYTKLSEEITPTGFKIYMDSGSGFNFSSPDATVAYGIGGINNEFSWISGALTHGQIYRFCVRSYRTGKGESQNTDYVATDADSEGPAAITGLQASYEEI